MTDLPEIDIYIFLIKDFHHILFNLVFDVVIASSISLHLSTISLPQLTELLSQSLFGGCGCSLTDVLEFFQ